MAGPKKQKKQPFWLGGAAAAMAATFTHPLDQTKYRMQVMKAPSNLFVTLFQFAKRDGITTLWKGMTASWLRQCTYSTARFGFNDYFVTRVKKSTGQQRLTSSWEIVCSGVAGGLAGLIGNPTEVALVRMCADAAKPPADRYGYRNGVQAVWRVYNEEGLRTLYKGLTPNVVRSVIMNVSQIATYSAAKRQLLATPSLGLKDDTGTHFLASLLAGTVATTACAPADVLKSRIQNAATVSGPRPSLAGIILDSYRKEGFGFFFRGWTPAWLRLAPNTILTFVFLEKLKEFVVKS